MKKLILLLTISLAACSAQSDADTQPAKNSALDGSKPSLTELLDKVRADKTIDPKEEAELADELNCEAPENDKMRSKCDYIDALNSLPPEDISYQNQTENSVQTAQLDTAQVPSPLRPPPLFDCVGKQAQGSALLCTTEPGAKVEWNGIVTHADQDGKVIIGFDRDAKPSPIEVYYADGNQLTKGIAFDNREYDISRIDGLPKNQVSEYTEDELARIRAATARKKVGFASRQANVSLTPAGFASPISEFRKTTNFGAQRILNGIEKNPHYGVDMAAPAGTPIMAPASGYVSLADDDMYFEGSLIMIDHGQGLISYYLHMQDINVEAGQWVETGDQIGTVGSRGRSTGPHLCWRLKWRGQNLDPELLTAWSE